MLYSPLRQTSPLLHIQPPKPIPHPHGRNDDLVVRGRGEVVVALEDDAGVEGAWDAVRAVVGWGAGEATGYTGRESGHGVAASGWPGGGGGGAGGGEVVRVLGDGENCGDRWNGCPGLGCWLVD